MAECMFCASSAKVSDLRQAVLIGATGFLGKGVEARFQRKAGGVCPLLVANHRRLISALSRSSLLPEIKSIMDADVDQDWIVATGLVDPDSDPGDLLRINVEVPLRLFDLLVDGARPRQRRLVTFGSVLENRPDLANTNAYLESKAKLLEAWQARSNGSPVAWIHLQLHTLYGGGKPPHPFMFTGQMFSALSFRTPFPMSAGGQLREYHHLDDVAESLAGLLSRDALDSQCVTFSSGCPVRLRDLASSIFTHFGAEDLLLIGARSAADAEVFDNPYRRSPELIADREPCEGVIRWFETLGLQPAHCASRSTV